MKVRRGFVVVLLFVAILLSGTVFAGFQLYKGALYEQERAEVDHSAHHIGSELSIKLESRQRTVELVSNSPSVADHGSAAQRRALATVVNETAFSGVSVMDADGTMTNIVAGLSADERRALVGGDFSQRTYYRRAMAGETYISDPIAAESGHYIVTVSTPIRRDGEIVGTLNAAYHLPGKTFTESATSALESGDGITITTRSGDVVYSSEPATDSDLIVRSATVDAADWTVSVKHSRKHLESTVRTVSYLQFGSVLLVLLSLTGFGWWVYRRNLHQVEKLLDGFHALENQEYGTEIDVDGGDEWQTIRQGFNEMSRSLDRYETERQERERALREFKRAVEQAGYAVFITDVDGTITYVNPAFEEITGYSREEVIGETPHVLNSGQMPDEYFTDLWSTILSGRKWDQEIINQRRNGTNYWAHQTVTPLTDADGSIEEFVAIQSDITELRDRERHLQTLSRVLRHNLRNKINVITSHAELLAHEADCDPETAGRIVETGRELTELADKERRIIDLLVEQPRSQTLPVPELVDAVATRVQRDHPESAVEVTCPDGVSVHAIDHLQRGIYELVENSVVHAERDDPTVRVVVEPGGETVSIRVEDDGPGIPAAEQRILTGDADIKPLSHGSGLGLWLVHHIVRLSGGTIQYAETTPAGCSITVEVPRR